MQALADAGWQVGPNFVLLSPPGPIFSLDPTQGNLPQARFLSLDPTYPDYARIATDSPLAKSGAGGAWPAYIGALPPGPAPKEGDWFTRVRKRWLDSSAEPAAGQPPVTEATA